ncbi:nitroreductase [miscellaneous Crenarchaeota group-15 archaeon DG-45]|uniref:Nitroreductase n=1 Tax=miscellaneous Crenarchaeota group-15 archaeon DG-45 TaxID=1685127 RepID=A0A0M0BM95_9ARCH|nr:MAG: nitroreductase [miscellaneous Crenarchaeota group-15 archaeon DG-45]
MDVFEAISRRMTIRDFRDEPVPMDVVLKLIDAGMKAPSNDHMRRWEFVVVQDRSVRKKIVECIEPIPRARAGEPITVEGAAEFVDRRGMTDELQREMYINVIPKQLSMILGAGCLIVPCYKSNTPLLEPKTLSSLNPFASIWCCVENILVMAASLGIFGVTRIPMEDERAKVKVLLGIPEGYEFPCFIALGYPREGATRTKQIEIKTEDRIHVDKWYDNPR